MTSPDRFNLERFVTAQAPVFETVLAELRAGRKRTHWIWFVFPQLSGLGRSPTARFYAIGSINEARAYLAHPVLGPRLDLCTRIVRASESSSLHAIFGSPDDMKFRSCMTLFSFAADNPDNPFRHASIAGAAVSPTSKPWRLSMQADELIDAGQSLTDRTVSAESEVRQ
jgi:uncharacterized protein (DUF1810 family)